jgi:hypothetical protein
MHVASLAPFDRISIRIDRDPDAASLGPLDRFRFGSIEIRMWLCQIPVRSVSIRMWLC